LAHAIATAFQRSGKSIGFLSLLDADPRASQAPPEVAFAEIIRQLGYDPAGDLLDLPTIYDFLCNEGHLPDSLDRKNFEAMMAVSRNTHTILHNFVPDTYRGHVLLFTSTIDQHGTTSTAEAWKSYIKGNITTYEVAFRHKEMMDVGPLAEIGPIIARELKRTPNH